MGKSQGRKYLITINNPAEHGFSRKSIEETLASLKPEYYCLSDEIGKEGTYHTHGFIFRNSPIRFETLKKRFPTAHIDPAFGSCQENRDYVAKTGKWANDEKADTSVEGSFSEWGNMPTSEEKESASGALIESIESGMSTSEIVRKDPKYVFRVNDIGVLRETLLADRFMVEHREVNVIYLFGPTGSGKTSSIFSNHDAKDICRITSYPKNGIRFDAYHGQSVLVFEEYHSQIPIGDFLNYLDRYPLMLPARYSDRVACYSTVYITSNRSLSEQYCDIQEKEPLVWMALLRRICKVYEFRCDGTKEEHPLSEFECAAKLF